LNDLSQLKFLVMDEADRMVQLASFPQLIDILDAVHQANPMHDEDDESGDDGDKEEDGDDDDEDESDKDGHRMLGLPGLAGEAKVEMLNDNILKRWKQQQKHSNKTKQMGDNDVDEDDSDGDDTNSEDGRSDNMVPQVNEMEDEEFEQHMKAVAEYNPQDDEDDNDALPLRPPVHRQTFIYSATLTLPSSTSNVQSFRRNNNGRRRKGGVQNINVDGAIAEILEKANAKGKTKVVDLTSMDRGSGKHTTSVVVPGKSNKETTTTNASTTAAAKVSTATNKAASSSASFRLPPGLELQQIKCTQRHKDSHLFGYLMTTKHGLSSGPCLVFCNSIAGVRRVGATLQALGLHGVRILHAQMQQVSAN
jgi:ATP-dependent RNA helicase DDX24/MAK5